MSVKMSGSYLGEKKVRLVHDDSGTTIQTAAPKDNQGDGSSFSPTDLFAISFAACVLSIIGIDAEKDGTDLTGARFTVEKEMSAEPPRRIAAINVEMHLPAALSEQQRSRFEAAAKTCPVHRSLHPDVIAEVKFIYDA